MDILNLSQNAGHASGLPMQAETIAGQSGAQSSAGQTQPGFNDALMNVVSTLMGGQGKNALGITVSAQPVSVQDEDDTGDRHQKDASPLKDDAQQQLLQALLMTGQMPVKPVCYAGRSQNEMNALTLQTQPLLAGQLQEKGALSPTLRPTLAAGVNVTPATESPQTPTAGLQHITPQLMTAVAVATPTVNAQPVSVVSTTPTAAVTPDAMSAHTSTLKLDTETSRWTQQLQSALGDRLQLQVKNQIQHATIRLDPPEMGKIDISLQLDNGRVQVQINASHAEVYRALQQTSNDLRQSLTEQNFVQVNVQVSSQSGQQQGKEQQFAQQHAIIQAGDEIAAGLPESESTRREDDSVLLTV